jgi:DNA-binding response OmpR family regulator
MVCDDLIFTSRVTATARAHGLQVIPVRSGADALRRAGETIPRCLILDLHTIGADVAGFLAGLRAACPVMPRIVAYGSHVNTELLQAARDAGCDVVLSRGQFTRDLETNLPVWMTAPGALQSSPTTEI